MIMNLRKGSLTSFGRGMLVCLVILAHPTYPASERPTPQRKNEPSITIKVPVDLVSLNASVTDKKGNPIKDLTEQDFRVFEDGVPQKISLFHLEVAPEILASSPDKAKVSTGAGQEALMSRTIILFVDDYHINFGDLARLKKAGEKFVRTNLTPTDCVALVSASGRYSTGFTQDRELIISALNRISIIATARQPSGDCPPLSDYQAIEIAERRDKAGDPFTVAVNDTIACSGMQGGPSVVQRVLTAARERAEQINDESKRTMFALHDLVSRLKGVGGPKTIVFLSDGLIARQANYQIQEVIDGAIRANTVIASVNTSGLQVSAIGGESPTASSGTIQSVPVRFRLDQADRFARDDAPSALASDTGGKYYHNNNDLHAQLTKAALETPLRYFLGYYSNNNSRDGRFRKIVVKVDRPNVVVTARKGYYAPQSDEANEDSKKGP
ncbi:MAG: VWA domain-containing protein [Acidobacteriia bacterium]|nr:VWA domain-containing protein [Terriglobia bacterium]